MKKVSNIYSTSVTVLCNLLLLSILFIATGVKSKLVIIEWIVD